MKLLLLALVSTVASVACLNVSWRRSGRGRRRLASFDHSFLDFLSSAWLALVGWILLAVAAGVWIKHSGAEFGIVFALLSWGLCAGIALCFNAEFRSGRSRIDKSQLPKPLNTRSRGQVERKLTLPNVKTLSRHVGLFLGVVPLAGTAAVLLSGLIALVLPWSRINAMAFGVLLMPVLWGLGAYWLLAHTRRARSAIGLGLCALLSGAFLYAATSFGGAL